MNDKNVKFMKLALLEAKIAGQIGEVPTMTTFATTLSPFLQSSSNFSLLTLKVVFNKLVALLAEKILYQSSAFFLAHTFCDFGAMIQALVLCIIVQRTRCSPFRIIHTKNNL